MHLTKTSSSIERELNVSVISRGTELKITGEDEGVSIAARAITALLAMAGRGESIGTQTVQYVIGLAKDGRESEVHTMSRDVLCITAKGKPVGKAKTLGQKKYMEAIRKNTIVMGVGRAGTGRKVATVRPRRRSRPFGTGQRPPRPPRPRSGRSRRAEEAGLPARRPAEQGRPVPAPAVRRRCLICSAPIHYQQVSGCWGSIEVAPLAYMRGQHAGDDSFIILDEAQNTTPEQMKMFLTRLGFGSKAVITGDITQIDLPDGKQSGLREALRRRLDGVEGISPVLPDRKGQLCAMSWCSASSRRNAEYENKKGKGKPAAKPAGKRLPTRRKEGK